jgi:formylglycine-generating enzyme required for sulfatase activity
MASLSNISSAQTITETFGTGVNAFTMDFVTIGNPGNAADTTGSPNPAGAVSYTYQIGKYEVSRDMVNKGNILGNLGITMADMSANGGNGNLRPATGISWNEAARFVNYLNLSYGSPLAYKFTTSPSGVGYVANSNITYWSSGTAEYNSQNPARNKLAKFFLPDLDEWYKAAYFSAANNKYYDYATGSDSVPYLVSGGTSSSAAVYNGISNGPADVNFCGALSPYGTMGQNGNAAEWIEEKLGGGYNSSGEGGGYMWLKGGGWTSSSWELSTSGQNARFSVDGLYGDGFRVAAIIPEPSSLSLLTLGGLVVALRRRR